MSTYTRQERDHLQGTPDAYGVYWRNPQPGKPPEWVLVDYKTGGDMIGWREQWRRQNQRLIPDERERRIRRVECWFTTLAVIAVAGCVVIIAAALGGWMVMP